MAPIGSILSGLVVKLEAMLRLNVDQFMWKGKVRPIHYMFRRIYNADEIITIMAYIEQSCGNE